MFGKIWKIVSTIILIVLIALVATMVLPRVFGIKPLVVLSGSMEPKFHVGSLLYVEKASPDDVEVGDAITFYLGDSDTVVTHRIVVKDQTNQTFTTKGDANEENDGAPVPYSNLIGKAIFSIPYLGFLAAYLTTRTGTIVLITAIIVVLILTFIPDLLKEDSEHKEGAQVEK